MKKAVSVLLCMVMVFISMSMSASAFYKIPEFENLKICDVDYDENRAVIIATRVNGNFDGEVVILTTTDGKNYSSINVSDYFDIEEAEYVVFNHNYVFDNSELVLAVQAVKVLAPEDEYDEGKCISEAYILKTSDFINFEKYEVTKYLDKTKDVETDPYCIDSINLVKLGNDYLISSNAYGENKDAEKNNIFYITNDFISFEKYEFPMHDSELVFHCEKVGNGLVVIAIGAFRMGQEYSYRYAYYTDSYTDFVKIWDCESINIHEPRFWSFENNKNEIYVFSRQYLGPQEENLVFYSFDLTTGKKENIFSFDCKYTLDTFAGWYWICDDVGYLDMFIENADGTRETYIINFTEHTAEKINLDYFLYIDRLAICDLDLDNCLVLCGDDAYILDLAHPENAQIIKAKEQFVLDPDFSYYDSYSFYISGTVFVLFNMEKKHYGEYETKILEIPINTAQNKMGDLTGDNLINSSDALKILQFSVGSITLNESVKAVADVNKDGKINSTDALKVLQYSVGQIKEF